RGRAVAEPGAELLERLKSRKARVGEAMEKEKATRRFEPSEAAPVGPIASAVPGAQAPPRPKPPAPAKAAAGKEQADDFAPRPPKAKKRALEDREKEKKDKEKPSG